MYLVAGLAIAGLAGIVAAFYFSIRSGKRGGKRLRPAGAGRVGDSRGAASRGGGARRPDGRPGSPVRRGQTEFALRASGPARPVGGSRPAAAPPAALTESWPAAPSDLDDPEPGAWPEDAWPGDSTATDPGLRVAKPGPGEAKPRRRGFRKGADIDEELWPAETFGGVSDEQFWDDLASDKPLTTTARSAQAEAGPRSRLVDTGTDTDPQGTQALGGDRSRGGRSRASRGIPETSRSVPEPSRSVPESRRSTQESRRSAGSGGYGAYPGPRAAPDPAAERTAVQPAYAATQPVKSTQPVVSTQPVKSMTTPAPGVPQSFQNAAQPVKSATPPPGAPQPVRAAAGGSPGGPSGPPRGPSAQPGQAVTGQAGQPGQAGQTGRRRRPSSAEDDPLTSAAFSLRQRGPVNGRSSLRPRDQDENGVPASGPGRGPASPYGHAAPYPPAGTSYDDASSATQMMSTPPYGESHGYGGGGQPDHPRRQNGTRSHARPAGPGERARPAYPQDTRPASGSYPAGAYSGNGSHGQGYQPGAHQGRPGGGTRGNGHRAPYDPRDDYRRLTHQR